MTPTASRSGFVLLAVLALLVVLSLLAAGVATTASRAVEQMAMDQERFQSELDRFSTRETLLTMLATQRRTLAGLRLEYVNPSAASEGIDENTDDWLPVGNEVRLDGRAYIGIGNTHFAIVDDRSRISVNWAPPLIRHALYARLGALPEQWGRLDDIRLDYQDSDDLRRIDGAESDEYERLGLPPPANRPLTSPLELRRLPVWKTLLEGLSDTDILQMISVTRELSINLNTAPTPVLTLLPGVGPENANRLVALREAAPLTSLMNAQQDFGLAQALDEHLNLYANSAGDLILWDRRFGTRQVVHWTLSTLGNTGKPWRIEYEVTVPRVNLPDQRPALQTQAALLATTTPDRP